jgi:hypothetical protein
MRWYELTKLLHFMGLLSMGGYAMFYARIGGRLRGAATVGDARTWLGLLRASRGMLHGGAGLLLLSGIIMIGMRWHGAFPFATIGMIALLAIWLVGIIPGRHLRALDNVMPTNDGPVSPELRAALVRPLPWMVGFAANLSTLGVLFIMTVKPGWGLTTGIVIGMAALGAVIGRSAVQRESREPQPGQPARARETASSRAFEMR